MRINPILTLGKYIQSFSSITTFVTILEQYESRHILASDITLIPILFLSFFLLSTTLVLLHYFIFLLLDCIIILFNKISIITIVKITITIIEDERNDADLLSFFLSFFTSLLLSLLLSFLSILFFLGWFRKAHLYCVDVIFIFHLTLS